MTRRWPLLLLAVVAACAGDDGGDEATAGAPPDFPADYAQTYTEVRNCRPSGDHDLNNIRILADPAALAPYQGRAEPFPVGAVVLKEEYGFDDLACAGAIKQWTVMRRLEPGAAPDNLDWAWQRVDVDRQVVSVDEPRCIGCHKGCGAPPDGYEWTCALP